MSQPPVSHLKSPLDPGTVAPTVSARVAFLSLSVVFGFPSAVAALVVSVPATLSALWSLVQGEVAAGAILVWSVTLWTGAFAWVRLSWAWCSGGQRGLSATDTRWWIALAIGALACSLVPVAMGRITEIVWGAWLLLMGPPMLICAMKLAWLRWGWWGTTPHSSEADLPASGPDMPQLAGVQHEESPAPSASPMIPPEGRSPVQNGVECVSDRSADPIVPLRAAAPLPDSESRRLPPVKSSSQQIWFALNCCLIGLPLTLVSLACVVYVLFVSAHGGDVGGVILAFLIWFAAVGASALALVRLSWRWLFRHEPMGDASPYSWRLLQATLLAQLVAWFVMLHVGADIGFDSRSLPLVLILLIPGVPLAGGAAHLAWVRRREVTEGRAARS